VSQTSPSPFHFIPVHPRFIPSPFNSIPLHPIPFQNHPRFLNTLPLGCTSPPAADDATAFFALDPIPVSFATIPPALFTLAFAVAVAVAVLAVTGAAAVLVVVLFVTTVVAVLVPLPLDTSLSLLACSPEVTLPCTARLLRVGAAAVLVAVPCLLAARELTILVGLLAFSVVLASDAAVGWAM